MRGSSVWGAVLKWFVVSRLVIAVIGVVGIATFVNHRTGTVVQGMTALDPSQAWHKWDSLWYERIAVHGYAHELDTLQGQAAAGFFPLYPLTVGLLLKVLPGVSFFWVASLLSNLLAVAALVLLARSLVGDADALGRVLAIVMTGAGSFYLSIPYTESLFLLLVVAVMVASRQRSYLVAALLAGLAATTRVHGLALVAVPAVACWLDTSRPVQARLTRVALVGLIFAVPVAVYGWYLMQVQGSAGAFIERQAMWDNAFPYPLKAIVGFVEFPTRVSQWVHGGYWMLYVGLLARCWRRMPLGEALFCAGALLISTQQESFHGIYRYVLVLIPMSLALSTERREVQLFFLAMNLVFGAVMILAFVTNNRLTV